MRINQYIYVRRILVSRKDEKSMPALLAHKLMAWKSSVHCKSIKFTAASNAFVLKDEYLIILNEADFIVHHKSLQVCGLTKTIRWTHYAMALSCFSQDNCVVNFCHKRVFISHINHLVFECGLKVIPLSLTVKNPWSSIPQSCKDRSVVIFDMNVLSILASKLN